MGKNNVEQTEDETPYADFVQVPDLFTQFNNNINGTARHMKLGSSFTQDDLRSIDATNEQPKHPQPYFGDSGKWPMFSLHLSDLRVT